MSEGATSEPAFDDAETFRLAESLLLIFVRFDRMLEDSKNSSSGLLRKSSNGNSGPASVTGVGDIALFPSVTPALRLPMREIKLRLA